MKNILILGATSDMAQAIAKKYVLEGWRPTLAARNADDLAAIASDLKVRAAIDVLTAKFDAVDYASHENFYKALPEKPDLVVAAFGYMGDQDLARTDFSEAERTIAVNFTGMVSILNIVASDFEARGEGCIAAISSVAGDRGRQSNYMYGSAKAGLTAYLAGLRNRLAKKNVHVMTIKPGFCRTKMTESLELPSALTANPEQVAEAVFKGVERKNNVIYTLWMWRFIMLIIRHIPEAIFKKLSM